MLHIPVRTGVTEPQWKGPFPNKEVNSVEFKFADGHTDNFYMWGRPKPSGLLIPITTDGKVIWTRQWRPGIVNSDPSQDWVWELPGGHDPSKVELLQEAGCRFDPDNVVDLGNIWVDAPSNSALVRVSILFGCELVGEPRPEKSEVIERVIDPIRRFVWQCTQGRAKHRDAKTLAAFTLALPELMKRGLVTKEMFL